MKRTLYTLAGGLAVSGLLSVAMVQANASETPLGKAKEIDHMEVGAVYLQPVKMKPMGPVPFTGNPDAHLEIDIHATPGNSAFPPGAWIPYLEVAYHLEKFDSKHKIIWQQVGWLMPMVANDGPHYGANVKLDGVGKYRVDYEVYPPVYTGMFRHVDKATGVKPWFKPFDAHWNFTYLGTGKKGGY